MARILIVEDEEKIARFVTLELEHEGYQVEHAADGRTAVDLALERDYDLILLDVLLPQLNGMEVLRRVRKHKDVPVTIITGTSLCLRTRRSTSMPLSCGSSTSSRTRS